MGLYIKGMEIPKDDKQITIKNYWINKEIITSAYDSVTNEFIGVVVEIPEPHGRLIDVDAYKIKYDGVWTIFDEKMMELTPTVIEAEDK